MARACDACAAQRARAERRLQRARNAACVARDTRGQGWRGPDLRLLRLGTGGAVVSCGGRGGGGASPRGGGQAGAGAPPAAGRARAEADAGPPAPVGPRADGRSTPAGPAPRRGGLPSGTAGAAPAAAGAGGAPPLRGAPPPPLFLGPLRILSLFLSLSLSLFECVALRTASHRSRRCRTGMCRRSREAESARRSGQGRVADKV
eukprot:494702-Prorocentrum_minimum.AAC.3